MKSADGPRKAPPQPLDTVVADSLEQFSARTSLSLSTLYYMSKRGELRTVKSRRRTLVPRSEILRFMATIEGKVA